MRILLTCNHSANIGLNTFIDLTAASAQKTFFTRVNPAGSLLLWR